jgi:hypothetical protein
MHPFSTERCNPDGMIVNLLWRLKEILLILIKISFGRNDGHAKDNSYTVKKQIRRI